MANGRLQGMRVVVTRATEQAGSLASLLRERGATPVELPTIKTEPPNDWSPIDHAISNLQQYDWVIFTSANAVRYLVERIRTVGQEPDVLNSRRVAAIGTSTATALASLGVNVSFIPTRFVAESVVDEMSAFQLDGKRILLPQARDAREVLGQGLTAFGAIVDQVVAYRTGPDGDALTARRIFAVDRVDVVTLTSSSAARNLVALLGDDAPACLDGVVIASIGPITSQTVRELGLSVTIEASEHTIRGLVEALEAAPHP